MVHIKKKHREMLKMKDCVVSDGVLGWVVYPVCGVVAEMGGGQRVGATSLHGCYPAWVSLSGHCFICPSWADTVPQALQTAEPWSDHHCHPVIRSLGDSETDYAAIARSLSLYLSEEIALIKSLLKIDKKMGQANPHLAGSPVRF